MRAWRCSGAVTRAIPLAGGLVWCAACCAHPWSSSSLRYCVVLRLSTHTLAHRPEHCYQPWTCHARQLQPLHKLQLQATRPQAFYCVGPAVLKMPRHRIPCANCRLHPAPTWVHPTRSQHAQTSPLPPCFPAAAVSPPLPLAQRAGAHVA